jgi:hypothetical protein
MIAAMTDIQIPGKAVSDGVDLRLPVRSLLEDLNLLGTEEEESAAKGFGAIISGPPQSVALIEAGATAAAKWWAAGLGTAAVAAWGAVAAWWPDQEVAVKVAVLGGASLVTAALAIAIGYLIASDVRGRAAAAVSLIEARATVATDMIEAAVKTYVPPADTPPPPQLVPVPGQLRAHNLTRPAADEAGWRVVAMAQQSDGTFKYIAVKGSSQATLSANELTFEP